MSEIHLRPPGSGTQEYKGYSVISELMIPIWQAACIGIVVGVGTSVVGWLIIQAGPVVLSIAIGLALGIGSFLVMRLTMHVDSRIAIVVAALLSTFVMVRLAEVLFRLGLWDAEWYVRVGAAIVGFGWLGPAIFGILVVYRFWHEVTQHQFVPSSDKTREITTYVPVPKNMTPPVINGGMNRVISPEEIEELSPQLVRTSDEQKKLELDFYDFVRLAAEYGLSRSKLVTQPRLRLAGSGQRLTRGVYDTFIEEMEANRMIVRGSDGVTTEWADEWRDDTSALLRWLAGKVGFGGALPARPVACPPAQEVLDG